MSKKATLTPLSKIILAGLVFAGCYGLWNVFGKNITEAFSGKVEAKVPLKATLPPLTIAASENTNVELGTLTSNPVQSNNPMRLTHWAWNAHAGLMLANGGKMTTKGSLMDQLGVQLRLTRQDDVPRMQEALIAFAEELHTGNPNPSAGTHFVTIMGDGGAVFLKDVNDRLRRLGPEYTAVVIGSCGYSRGEDQFMGPSEWKSNPQLAKGGVTSGYLRDGDWNITLKWLGDNDIKNNPDETTYDPDAMNWVAADDYIDAAQKYVTGYTEERDEVKNGKRTGKKVTIKIDAVTTWTPGDVIVAEKKGGLVRIVSTKEYASQMPNIIIGIKKWVQANPKKVENMLSGIFAGGDAIKSSDEALKVASNISALVYDEPGADAAYWYKYFKGATVKDKQGLSVELGGSSVNNLADNAILFGLVPGSQSLFAATYNTFGEIAKQQYPELIPEYDPVDEVVDTSFIKNLMSRQNNTSASAALAIAKPRYDSTGEINTIGSSSKWRAFFQPGQTSIPENGSIVLRKMLQDLLVAGGAVIEINAHADGRSEQSKARSIAEERGFALKNWLTSQDSVNFPAERIRVVVNGSDQPLEANTVQGSVMNRRVEVKIGTSN